MLVLMLLVFLFALFPGTEHDIWVQRVEAQQRWLMQVAALIAWLVADSIVVVGAFSMYQLHSYRWAVAAAVLAMIPVLAPFVVVTLPLGGWALVVLRRREVSAAFA